MKHSSRNRKNVVIMQGGWAASQTCSLSLPSREGKKEGRWNQRKKNHSSDTSTVNKFFRVNLGPSEGEKN
jgi:hypothetical protein